MICTLKNREMCFYAIIGVSKNYVIIKTIKSINIRVILTSSAVHQVQPVYH